MNRAQKNAWFGLVNCIIAVIFFIELFLVRLFHVPVPGFKFAPQPSQTELFFRAMTAFWPLALPVLALILLLIPRKKQSPVEPDFDELDRVIQNKAIRISFVAVWFLWPMALILTMLKTGIAGNLPAILYLYVHLGVFLICMAIYFLTKIILYKNQTEGGVI
ncbi:MAG: hypothetical protein ACYSO4_10180 [Planctomycetota bacterium]|jgi:hypothetical protein